MAYLGRKGQTAPLASADLPTNSISTDHLIANSVTSAKIGVDVIVAEDIANNAITVAEIADDAVTGAKLANDIAISTTGAITTTGAFTSKGIDDNADALAMTIDSSENVLINTTQGFQSLNGRGNLVVGSGSANEGMTIYSGTTGAGSIMFADGTSSTDPYTGQINYEHSDNSMRFNTNGGTERMRIASNGTIGLGGAPGSGSGYISTGEASRVLFVATNSRKLELGTENSTKMTIDTSGAVGIGTTSPVKGLHINDASDATLILTRNAAAVTAGQGLGAIEFGNIGETVTPKIDSAEIKAHAAGTWSGSDTSSYMTFLTTGAGSTTATERMRIDQYGQLFVATTTAGIVGSSTLSGVMLGAGGYSTFAANSGACVYMNRTGNSDGQILFFRKDGVSVGSISTNGNSLPSDLNFKRDIDDLDLGLELVNKLNPKEFRYNISDDESPKMYGLIAQEIEVALEECGVVKNSAILLQHEPTEEENQSDYSLDYLKLTPILINSVKELSAKNDALEARILALENA